MYAVIGHDQRIYCTVECLRRQFGVRSDPYRMAFTEEYDDFCAGCGADLKGDLCLGDLL